MTPRALSDAELDVIGRHGREWRDAGWSAEQITAARALAVNDISAEQAPDDDLAPLLRTISGQLADVRAERTRKAAEIGAEGDAEGDDLELAP